MAKKKREHIVFDQMLKQKKNIPFSMVNKENTKKRKKKAFKGRSEERRVGERV